MVHLLVVTCRKRGLREQRERERVKMIILLAALVASAITEKCQVFSRFKKNSKKINKNKKGGARQLTLEDGGGSFAVVEISRAKVSF